MTVRPTSVIILNQFARHSWLNGVQEGGLPLLQQQCALGVNTDRIYAGTLVTGAALAGLAGAVLAPLTSAYPTMGLSFLTNSFFAVLVGGLGSLPGLALASISLGGSDELTAIF